MKVKRLVRKYANVLVNDGTMVVSEHTREEFMRDFTAIRKDLQWLKLYDLESALRYVRAALEQIDSNGDGKPDYDSQQCDFLLSGIASLAG